MEQIWIAFVGLLMAGILQVVCFAFFLGRLFETVNSLKRRTDALEKGPATRHEARLSAIDATMNAIKENLEASEARVEERFRTLEGTIRSMMQFRDSANRRGRDAS